MFNEDERLIIIDVLNELRVINIHNDSLDNEFIDSLIDEIEGIIDFENNVSVKLMEKNRKEYLINSIYFLFFAHLSLAVDEVPENQIYADTINSVNINFVLKCILIQITSYIKSVLVLLCNGMDSAANIICRSLTELSWLMVVLLHDDEKMKIYADPEHRHTIDDFDKYENYFKPAILKKHLASIEESVIQDTSLLKELKKIRNHNYNKYSKYIHNSYEVTIVKAWTRIADGSETIIPSFYGDYSLSSKSILTDLKFLLFYTSHLVTEIIHKQKKFKFLSTQELGINSLTLNKIAERFCTDPFKI